MKRFYKAVTVAPVDTGWQVTLDGRGIKTVGGRPQVVPSSALADALAAEWAAQGAELDPARFTLRDMVDYAIDVVQPDPAAAVRAILAFAETDTLCYRGDEGEALYARQCQCWDPLLTAAEHRWDVRFERVCGIIHRAQPAETLRRMEAVVAAQSTFALAALYNLASLSASLVIGLAALEPQAGAEELWNAANLEEDWQAELWGHDAEAQALRARRLSEFTAAMRFAAMVQA